MNYFYFDASALVKRYVEETGSNCIDEIFDQVSLTRLMGLIIGASEVTIHYSKGRIQWQH